MQFAHRAALIEKLLLRSQALWRYNSYRPTICPITPTLQKFLLQLSDTEVHTLQASDHLLLDQLAPYLEQAKEISDVIALTPRQSHASTPIFSTEPPAGIPGRKWSQIQSFLAAEQAFKHHVIEWCSGKAYLGESISQRDNIAVTGLEIDTALVMAGNQRAAKLDSQHRICRCDVLSPEVIGHLRSDQHIVALHACGGLHQRMVQLAATQQCAGISLSPCCYHRFNAEYQALSSFFNRSPLQLHNSDLRSAVRQTNTASSSETLARRTLQARNFGVRQYLLDQGYPDTLTLPSLPQSWSKAGFKDIAETLLRKKGLTINLPDNLDHYEHSGWQQLKRAERIDLVRMSFRRVIELRCVLDSILFLEEQGYQCQLSEFCPPSISPRNLLIQANRP